MGSKGIVASTAAMAVLLQQGIGDTIRVSLTPEPGGDRTREVVVAQEILQTMGLRSFAPMVTACPGCGRTTSTTFQELAEKIQAYLRAQMPAWRARYPGVDDMHVAVMGCVVNGPGESKLAQRRHLAAGHRRNPGGAGLRRRAEDGHAQGRRDRRGVPGASSRPTSARPTAASRAPRTSTRKEERSPSRRSADMTPPRRSLRSLPLEGAQASFRAARQEA